ncbi:hypothetical protein [Spirochaeta isovalerica]|uniref:Uncharacterized protein n=1 Tax=Spirochaeta isovalerica TaxID=150 RepID=A0A841RER6_9SPIO|nr:hypothetical protein [Spirochaeta isovalerica]MBB6482483.1 hypothetical protein [Spirochaeta isovalerica]
MYFRQLTIENKHFIKDAAELLRKAFPQSYSDSADEEIISCLQDEKVVIGAIENNKLIGFVGAIPQYN